MTNETGTVRLHRVLPAPVVRVYKAFTDKQALEYWLRKIITTSHVNVDSIVQKLEQMNMNKEQITINAVVAASPEKVW